MGRALHNASLILLVLDLKYINGPIKGSNKMRFATLITVNQHGSKNCSQLVIGENKMEYKYF